VVAGISNPLGWLTRLWPGMNGKARPEDPELDRSLRLWTIELVSLKADHELAQRLKNGNGGWSLDDLREMQWTLVSLWPIGRLRFEACRLRDEYRLLVGESEYARYLGNSPLDLSKLPDTALHANFELEVRHDATGLLSEIHRLRARSAAYEEARSKILVNIARALSVLVVAAITYLALISQAGVNPPRYDTNNVPMIPVVLFTGMVGGFMSLWRRLHQLPQLSDPLLDRVLTKSGRKTLYLAPIFGAIGASLLYITFAGGLVQGALFPQMYMPVASAEPLTFLQFADQCVPLAGIDHAKLIVWSFAAGFSERLWVDTLDEIAARRESKQS